MVGEDPGRCARLLRRGRSAASAVTPSDSASYAMSLLPGLPQRDDLSEGDFQPGKGPAPVVGVRLMMPRGLARRSGVIPVFRNQRRWLGPRLFHQGVLEPLLVKVRVLGDNKLEAGSVLLRELIQ